MKSRTTTITLKAPNPQKLLSALATPPAKRTGLLRRQLSGNWSAVVLGGVLGIFSTGVLLLYFSGVSFTKVIVAGVPAGRFLSAAPLTQRLEQAAGPYTLKLRRPPAELKAFSLAQAGLTVDIPASMRRTEQLHASKPFWQRLQFWHTEQVPLMLKVDEVTYTAFINSQAIQTIKPAQDAALVIEKGVVRIVPPSTGEAYAVTAAKATILNGVAQLQAAPFVLEPAHARPKLIARDLEPARQKAAAILAQGVTINIAGKVIKATPAEVGTWVELNPVEIDKTVDVTVNSGKVLEYLNTLTKPYISVRRAQVVSTQPDGSSVILVTGQNGADIAKKEAVAAGIATNIAAGRDAEVNLPVTYAPFKTVTAQAYDKWLAIDVTTKRLYAYEKTVLKNTFLASAGAPATPTVLGQYAIYSKFARQDMRGSNADGSRYFQPNVQWVNYFYKDYAVHGNYWRPANYFGNINSSHGCVGIVNTEAEWLYNWAPIGTPVIVYD